MWEGVNPYLDPASVEAQKRYISAIVSRYAKSTNVSWDLINEPSVCNPRKVFSGPKPNGDIYEIIEWRSWLKEKYKDIKKLQEKWNCSGEEFTSFDEVMLPLESKEGVLSVPNEAILVEDALQYVYIVDSGKVKKTKISTGLSNDKITEVTEGLSEGASVITEGQSFLNDGEQVKISK
jgi:hypothetical protein